MSNARKLQTEIDRVMKKVDEGVDLFDEIWEKVYSAEQQNQKEKYEMDLKKEIKKLQRLRDSIKTWIGSSDVKDKDALVEARKLIETKMEQFKICEKETKTKTYSKEGLAREDKLDPAEEAKLNTTTWLGEYIEKFQQLVEEKDFEIERLSSGKGRKTNKHQIEELQEHIANFKFHIQKMEGIIRLVNNDRLDVDPVDSIKDDLDYYLESYNDEEYMVAYDEEFFYESLGLEELDVVNVDRVTQPLGPAKKVDDATSTSSKGSRDKKTSKKSALSSVIPLTIGRARSKAEKKEEEKAATPSKVPRSNSSSSTGSTGALAAPAPASARVIPAVAPSAPAVVAAPAAAPSITGATSMAAILKRETEQQEKERQKLREEQAKAQAAQAQAQAEQLLKQQQARQQQEALRQQEELRQQQEQARQEALKRQQEALRQQQQQQAEQEAAAAAALKKQQAEQEAATKLKQQQAEKEAATKQKQQQAHLQAQQQAAAEQAAVHSLQQSQAMQQQPQGPSMLHAPQPKAQQQQQQGNQANALELLTPGLAGLNISGGPEKRQEGQAMGAAGAVEAGASYLSALNDSFMSAPVGSDNERSRQYTPQNPYPTQASFPSTPSPLFENPAIFEKLGTDCLFFIFYYAQGTYQQYLAARELKKQSWRFHKKYMTWFQRHEEPKITTDEYEQGTYVYFDYETGWCTRIKQDFRFEYSFLEDSLQ